MSIISNFFLYSCNFVVGFSFQDDVICNYRMEICVRVGTDVNKEIRSSRFLFSTRMNLRYSTLSFWPLKTSDSVFGV